MATISTSGLVSGIDTDALITKLLALDSAPVTLLQNRITQDETRGQAYDALAGQLSALQTAAKSLQKPQTFGDTAATSSDESVLTATTSQGAAVGTYSLRVARTVSTQQLVSGGFADATSAKVGAGTITIGRGGGGNLTQATPLSQLNGGAGVARGQFRITDRSGASAVVDTSSAVSVDDVVQAINSATTVSVRAAVRNNHLVLTDTSGQTASHLIVQDLGTGTSAADLGIDGNVNSSTLTGQIVNTIGRGTLLSALNDGRGVTLGTGGATGDFTVGLSDGSTFDVNLTGVTTVGGAVDAINAASGGKASAGLLAGGRSLTLTDQTAGGGGITVAENNGSHAAADLGLTAAPDGGSLTGNAVLAGIDTTLLTTLNGGAGLALGTLTVTDGGGSSHTIDLSGAVDVLSVVNDINDGTNGGVRASLTSSGTGIQLTDATGGTGGITVAASATATALGLAAGASATGTVAGGNLGRQWVTANTALASLNGGQGIGSGAFTITTAAGDSTTVNLNSAVTTVGQLLYQINSRGIPGLTAAVNATGNGISLTDASNGGGTLTVTDNAGTAAADLNLKGTAATAGNATIDGAYSKTITVGPNDTLATVQAAINAAHAGVSATIISDGSSTAPARLSISADHSGTAGAVSFDAGTTGLGTQTLVAAQDAAVFVGGAGGGGGTAQPLLVTSSSDTVTNVIAGVSLSLVGTSAAPVQLTIAASSDSLVKTLTSFTTTFNTLTTTIGGLSTFNSSSNTGGLLLGDAVGLNITTNLFSLLGSKVPDNGNYASLYSVGFSVGADDQVSFDADTFNAALAADPAAVQRLFDATVTAVPAGGTVPVTTNTGVGFAMDRILTKLVDPVSGSVTVASKGLASEEQGFTDQITQLNLLLDQKKKVYQTQFAAMEAALANLQSQSAALGNIGVIKTSSSAFTSTSSSS